MNLSTTAVSLVLNARAGAQGIPAVTRERILSAARDLHYRPNVVAQALRRGRAFAVGVLVPDLAAAGSALAQAITEALRTAGYDALLATHHRRPDLVVSRARLMMERQVDGVIVADAMRLALARVPVVRLTYTCDRRCAPSRSVVALDLAAAADDAVQHVFELGHRRVALLSAAMPSGGAWGQALSRAARHIGVRIDTRRLRDGNGSHFDRGYFTARDLIADRAFYTTIFTSDDDAAIGVIRALREHDLAVPRDVSVVGFGGYATGSAYTPRMTTVSVPSQQAGERAARLLVGRIERAASSETDGSAPLSAVFRARDTTSIARRSMGSNS